MTGDITTPAHGAMPGPDQLGQAPVCPRHPDRVSYIGCQRCGRPACPECQRNAPVGIQCVDCVTQAARTAPVARGQLGGRAIGGTPVVTYSIIALCVVVWLAQMALPGVTSAGMFAPAMGWSQPWRFLTACFLHSPSGPTHLLFNMMALYSVGPWLERLMGHARFLGLYLLAGLGGSVAYLLMAPVPSAADPYSWSYATVGASGAVFGLFLAQLVVERSRGLSGTASAVVIGINAVLGFLLPGIAWQAHLGGALTGALIAFALVRTGSNPFGAGPAGSAGSRQAAMRRQSVVQWGLLAAVLALLVGLAVARYLTADLLVHTWTGTYA